MNATGRWVLYARAADETAVRAQLAELRAFVDGETSGRACAECSDVGPPGPGLQAVLALIRAGAAGQVAVTGMRTFGPRSHQLGEVIEQLGSAGAGLAVLETFRRAAGTPMPDDLQQQVREVFADAGVGPDELGERTPSWYHDGVLSLLRAQMRAAHADLDQAAADAPPGYGVPPELMRARLAAAAAEQTFAERLIQAAGELPGG